jgi:hypothetical protein
MVSRDASEHPVAYKFDSIYSNNNEMQPAIGCAKRFLDTVFERSGLLFFERFSLGMRHAHPVTLKLKAPPPDITGEESGENIRTSWEASRTGLRRKGDWADTDSGDWTCACQE